MKVHTQYPFYEELPAPDEKKKLKEEASLEIPGLEDLLEKFKKVLKFNLDREDLEDNKELDEIIDSISDILTPNKISLFIEETKKIKDKMNYYTLSSNVITKLIQNSYDAGHNGFLFFTDSSNEILGFCALLKGTKEKPIEVIVNGSVDQSFGVHADYVMFKIHGNAKEWLGQGSKSSSFEVHGDVENDCAHAAYYSSFDIKGNINGHIKDMPFRLGEIIKTKDYGPNGCTFIVYNTESYKKLLNELKPGNKAVLKDKNNKIIEEKTI